MDVLALSAETTNQLIAAAAALGGAIVGGLITTGATSWFERKRDAADLRQARRLVSEEVAAIYFSLDALIDVEVYPPRLDRASPFLPTSQWKQYRAALARHLDDSSWLVVSSTIESIASLETVIGRADPGPVPGGDLAQLEWARELAATAYSMLTGGKVILASPSAAQ